MTSIDESGPGQGPRAPGLTAALIFLAAALALCWPMFLGQFLVGPASDQYVAGYSFRHFAAEYFKVHRAIPQWNPYLFGGLPFIGAAHGDIFYPTAWLRWILPTDTAMNLGFAIHIVLAGVTMYWLMRTLKTSWAGAVVAGLSYELTGIVISMVHPGHDGKLFVAAVAPVLLLGIVRAVRDRDLAGYGLVALSTGLALQGHPQASYYLLIAGGIWGAFWVFGPEGPTGSARLRVIAGAAAAVALGVGLYAVYALPMREYVAYSPRAEGGYNSGYEYATSYALPPEELLGLVLPKIDGGTNAYFGRNGIKHHTEYLGPVVLMLAVLGLGGAERRRTRLALGTIGGLFLLVSLGGATPFFQLWYLLPMMSRLRAPAMGFFLVALPLAALAGWGAERLIRGTATLGRAWIVAGVAGLLALLGVAGILQNVAEDIARNAGFQGRIEMAIGNAAVLRADAIRLLVIVAAAAGILWAIARRRIGGMLATGALLVVIFADLWFVGREYFVFSPPASITYAPDDIMKKLAATPRPYRVYDPAASVGGANPYAGAWLMSAGIPTLFGYHGNELRTFDDLLGGKNQWKNQLSPAFWKMFGVRYIVINQAQAIPGFHQVLGPVTTRGGPGYLLEADTLPPYARVLTGAAKVPDDQLVATVADPRFPFDRIAVYPDTASVAPAALGGAIPEPSAVTAAVTEWDAGRMTVTLVGAVTTPQYLVVAENWYGDWHATIDGKPAPVLRAQGALLSVALPPGSRSVTFWFDSPAYHRGRAISLASLAAIAVLFGIPLVRRR